MKTIRLLAIAATLLSIPLLSTAKEIDLRINVKEQRTLAVPADLERIAVADPDIADVVVIAGNRNQPGSVILVGKKPGSTSVSAWSRNRIETVWKVRVQSALLDQLQEGGASIQVSEGNALIRGESPSVLSHANTAAVAAKTTWHL